MSHPTMFSPTAEEVALLWPNWALDDDQRHTFACELDGVSVAELVGAKRRRTPTGAAVRRRSARATALDLDEAVGALRSVTVQQGERP